MLYLMALVAIAAPVILVVQTIRGRVRPQCCSVPPERDLRLRVDPPVDQLADSASSDRV